MSAIRRLNENGLNALRAAIEGIKSGATSVAPAALLTDIATSEPLGATIEVEQRTFASRFEAAQYLDTRLSGSGLRSLERDTGLWAWLALFYFDVLCPPRRGGARKPGEISRWIPSESTWKYYRHLLAGPWRILRAHRDNPARAMILLCGPLDKPGDYVGQIASRLDLVINKAVVGSATLLYLDPVTTRPRRGAAPNEHRAGTLRRLIDVVDQLDVTWDTHALTDVELTQMLPSEFDRYRATAPPR